MRTQAVIHPRKSATEVAEVDLPPLHSDEVQVRTTLSAISVGTEGWVMNDVFSWMPTKFPCVPGDQRVAMVGHRSERPRIAEQHLQTRLKSGLDDQIPITWNEIVQPATASTSSLISFWPPDSRNFSPVCAARHVFSR